MIVGRCGDMVVVLFSLLLETSSTRPRDFDKEQSWQPAQHGGSVCRHPAEEGATSLMPCLHGFKLLFEEFTKGSPFDM